MNENKTNAPIKLPELLPCPFCGGEATVWRINDEREAYYDYHFVQCGYCRTKTWYQYDRDAAITVWNTRAALNEADALRAEAGRLAEALAVYQNRENWLRADKTDREIFFVTHRMHGWIEADEALKDAETGDKNGK